MNLAEKTLDELKVLAFDILRQKEQFSYSLNVIQNEIQKREVVQRGVAPMVNGKVKETEQTNQ